MLDSRDCIIELSLITPRSNVWTLRPRAERSGRDVPGLLLDRLRTRDDARQIGILTRSHRGGVCLSLAPLLALDFLVMLLFLASGFLESLVNRNGHWPLFPGACAPQWSVW